MLFLNNLRLTPQLPEYLEISSPTSIYATERSIDNLRVMFPILLVKFNRLINKSLANSLLSVVNFVPMLYYKIL